MAPKHDPSSSRSRTSDTLCRRRRRRPGSAFERTPGSSRDDSRLIMRLIALTPASAQMMRKKIMVSTDRHLASAGCFIRVVTRVERGEDLERGGMKVWDAVPTPEAGTTERRLLIGDWRREARLGSGVGPLGPDAHSREARTISKRGGQKGNVRCCSHYCNSSSRTSS